MEIKTQTINTQTIPVKPSISILLVASKKAVTRKQLSQESSTLNTWTEIMMDIYQKKNVTASAYQKLEQCVLYWENWVWYAKTLTPDFLFPNEQLSL